MRLSKREKLFVAFFVIVAAGAAYFFLCKVKTENIEAKERDAQFEKEVRSKVEKALATVNNATYHTKYAELIPDDPKSPKNVVLITIDDGPTKYAEGMMDTLDKHNAKAIFYINGARVKDAPQGILKNMVERGNTVGNHTWDHPNLQKISHGKAKIEIDRTSKLIEAETGTLPLFFRPPYGMSTQEVRDYVKIQGMLYMKWTGSALDWTPTSVTKEVFMNNVMKDLHPGEIILLHEHPKSAEYLDELLTMIESKGLTFLDPKNITNK